MNSQIQEILIRRKSKTFFKSTTQKPLNYKLETGMLGAIIGNFGSLGFVISKELFNELEIASKTELETFYKEVFPILQTQVGCNYSYFKPMYPNFPKQVANASDEELFINAILHYFGDAIGERIIPEYEKEVRFPFCESMEPRFLGLATEEEIWDMWINIFESKASPSTQDKTDIKTFFSINDDSNMSIIEKRLFTVEEGKIPSINNKEKLAFTLATILKEKSFDNSHFGFKVWSKDNVKTATDVLRIAVAYSNGDESLTKVSKFGKFPRPVRRLLLDLLNNMDHNSVQEDMKRFEGMWIRLAEKLHPGEYKRLKLQIMVAFNNLRNNQIITTNSKIETFLETSDFKELLIILKTRPGDFARRLNVILCKAEDKFAVIDAFKSIVDKVSTPVLWQLYGYFGSREKQLKFRNRIFLPKTPKALVSENNLQPINRANTVAILQIIAKSLETNYFNNKPIMNGSNVWIDPICNNLLIPSGNRSASTALRQVARGSRFPLTKDTVRLFVYWKDIEAKDKWGNRVDLDLSAVMFDKDFKFLGQCSWTNLRDAAMVHSGDITSAPNGAAEFLDINLNKLDKEVAFIACNVYCFTGQKMTELPIGFCGWMGRDKPNSGEIFEPLSVEGRCDLTADASSTAPMILDVINREIVWADLAVTLNGSCYSTESTVDKTIATAELITRMKDTRVSLFDVFAHNVLARDGKLVNERELANFVIAEDGDVSPYDIAKIMSEWI
jgi:stress response protein SCP2